MPPRPIIHGDENAGDAAMTVESILRHKRVDLLAAAIAG
jgi:hypothetical protein